MKLYIAFDQTFICDQGVSWINFDLTILQIILNVVVYNLSRNYEINKSGTSFSGADM